MLSGPMHELSIALNLIEVASEAARKCGEADVQAIHLKLGLLSGVDKDALRPAFELAREGTLLARAELVIEEIPVVLFCSRCQTARPAVSVQLLQCVECGTPSAQILAGREMEVFALEVP